ncbi:hypothetical protein MgSA37_03437 [Mucilaginibacter gotjawali]|uniref:Uncharacterized protein n=2 Tax=Mucilaginibacter gotjawali TaxID=1550579 RepID=A0A839SH43_9SPHI|nr:hypothetical protein [Mucilaginibacter gotjawali]BAU55256.1 hypothetical protein MgSA37_03437 [Mucilaginibacter gotjawali]
MFFGIDPNITIFWEISKFNQADTENYSSKL